MTRLRALVVDDEEPGRVNLCYALADHPRWEVAGACASAAAASLLLARGDIDLVFLDIQMPGESGLALASTLCAQPEPPLVVFVTAHNRYALEAFEVHALDYLLKPLNDQRLAQALERAEALLALRQRRVYGDALRAYVEEGSDSRYWTELSVRSVGSIERVWLADVDWIEACGNYVHLHTARRSILHRVPVSRLLQHLDPAVFLRVHRSAIVRLDQAERLEVAGEGAYRLLLRSGAVVAVSERHVAGLRQAMGAR